MNRFQNVWENIRSSLWFIPALMVLGAFVLAMISIRIDRWLDARESEISGVLFGGTGSAARTILSTIAGSLVTVISIAFSITVVALQQASAQFSPRVLRQFTADRGNQFVLGTYTGTFIYSLLVLRVVRSEEEDLVQRFVPAVSVTLAIGLALLCLALPIYFIHHMSQELQVSVIMDDVRRETIEQIDFLYPESLGTAVAHGPSAPPQPEEFARGRQPQYIRAVSAGYVRAIDEDALLNAPTDMAWVWIRRQVGEFVPYGGILAEVDRRNGDADPAIDAMRQAFVLDRERTVKQDPLFGIKLLVDIALRALSPGVNDPTTAEDALCHLGDIICRLADRAFPPNVRATHDGRTLFIFSRPTWDDYVDAAFSQIRRAAESQVHVLGILLRVLREIALRVQPGPRAEALRHQLDEIRRIVARQSFSDADKDALNGLADAVDNALRTTITAPLPLDRPPDAGDDSRSTSGARRAPDVSR